MITTEQGKALNPGTLLAFGSSPNLYEVIRVEEHEKDLHITLRRDDGLEIVATQYDLETAIFRGKAEREVTTAPDASPALSVAADSADPSTGDLTSAAPAEDQPSNSLPSRSKRA